MSEFITEYGGIEGDFEIFEDTPDCVELSNQQLEIFGELGVSPEVASNIQRKPITDCDSPVDCTLSDFIH